MIGYEPNASTELARPAQDDETAAPSITLYHGTSALHLSSIQKHGLLPCCSSGMDAGLIPEGDRELALLNKQRPPSVYVTANLSRATWMFAAYVAGVHKTHPVVLELRIPEHAFFDRFVLDEICEQPAMYREDYRTEQPIPPEWIAAVTCATTMKVRTQRQSG